ncbi:hypothetical protein Tco_0686313, partial [Tanacetum coccineum]
IMIKDIKQQLLERRIMRSLEKFIGGRDYETDYRLLQRTLLPRMCKTISNIDAHMRGAILEGKTIENWRDLPMDIPLDRVEVLRYDTKGVKVRKGIMQTKTELTLEQTQQGVSDEVLVSIEGVEE